MGCISKMVDQHRALSALLNIPITTIIGTLFVLISATEMADAVQFNHPCRR